MTVQNVSILTTKTGTGAIRFNPGAKFILEENLIYIKLQDVLSKRYYCYPFENIQSFSYDIVEEESK